MTAASARCPGRLALALAAAAGLVVALGAAPASAATDVDYVSITGFGSVVVITGESDVDLIDVSVAGGTITITDTGPGGITTAAVECSAPNATTVTCPFDPGGAPVRIVAVDLMEANDSYTNQNLEVKNQVEPGDGNDVVRSGPGDDFIDDSLGDDDHDGGAGDDFLDGTSGPAATGADRLDGGSGIDEVDYGGYLTGVEVSFDDQPNDGTPGEGDNLMRVERVFGTESDDSLTGDAGANEFFGDAGDDRLVGLAGNDELSGEEGDDVLNGGASPDGYHDRLDCGMGTDTVLADPLDVVEPNCERRGALVAVESASVRHGKARVSVECPALEVDSCAGELALFGNGREVGKATGFLVIAGETAVVKVKLTRFGKRELRRSHRILLTTARVQTAEAGGITVGEQRLQLVG